VFVLFELSGGGVFFDPKIRASNPGFFGGSCGESGIVVAPDVVSVLLDCFLF
jgi:hypothetical protein